MPRMSLLLARSLILFSAPAVSSLASPDRYMVDFLNDGLLKARKRV